MNGRMLLAATLLFLVALAGCIGQEEDSTDPRLERTAQVTSDTGGIQGVVTDTAVQSVAGANVTVVETNETVTTADDGSYAFSNLLPGSYNVIVRSSGFVSASESVEVTAGEVSFLDLVVTRLVSEEPYTQTFELVGFFECGFEVGWNLTDEVPAEPPVYDARYFYLGWATCATGGNVTNDKFSHRFSFEPPIHTVVYEMEWEASSQFSEWLTTSMAVQDFPNDPIGRFMRLQGPSPVHEVLGPETWDSVSTNFTEACEEGDDSYCGHNFRDKGWPLRMRVFPAWQCFSEDGGGCAAVQQEFTHYISAFYNTPAPEGYSVLEGDV